MNPYAEIRKVPLDYQGVQSNAYSVQTHDINKDDRLEWKEVGTVSSNYLLVPNNDVVDMAVSIVDKSGINFEEDKAFFDGKRFVLSYIAKDDAIHEVGVGDDIAIGFQMWNSYDGSTSLGFRMMLYRLECLNGMMSNTVLDKYRFRHDINSDNWQEDLEIVSHKLKAASRGDNNSIHGMIENFRKLDTAKVGVDELSYLRYNNLDKIPTSVWGSVMDRYLEKPKYTGWNLLNAATDELWHKEKPTVASYNHNASIVDGLCNWVQA